jgi:D-aminopeptidase
MHRRSPRIALTVLGNVRVRFSRPGRSRRERVPHDLWALTGTLAITLLILGYATAQQPKQRARDLGIPFDGKPGKLNAITDVDGVEVGHKTLIKGEGEIVVGKGPVRTGVTAIWPRGKEDLTPVFAGWFPLNGNGEVTGTAWVEESGHLEGPIMTTNTYSVGTVRNGVLFWLVHHWDKRIPKDYDDDFGSLPVVAETWDGDLNDIKGFHVKRRDVLYTLDHAKSGPVDEGNVGGGTGMTMFDFKGGIGTASRHLKKNDGGYIVGVLAQCNFGDREQLTVAGVPVGKCMPVNASKAVRKRSRRKASIIVVIATDAPLMPHQLKRLARRATHGLARTGSVSEDSSGDLFLAFSTANAKAARPSGVVKPRMLANDDMDPLFTATVQATEEAIINALIAADPIPGVYPAIDHERLQMILKKFNRLNPP